MPLASINPTNPRTNPSNFHKNFLRIGDFEKLEKRQLKGHFWSVAKVALRFGCAKQSKNIERYLVFMKLQLNYCEILFRYKVIVFRLQKGFDPIVRISIKDLEALLCWNNAYLLLYSRIYTYFVDFYCTRLDQVSGDDR
jgi:hypothetical protein